MSSSLEAIFVYGVFDDPACWQNLRPLPIIAIVIVILQASPFAVTVNEFPKH